MIRSSAVALVVLVLVAVLGVASQPERSLPDAEAEALLYDLSHVGGRPALDAMERIRASDDKRFIAVFIELQRAIVYDTDRDDHKATLVALSGEDFGRDWVAWNEWYAGAGLQPPPGFTRWKGAILGRIDPEFRKFLNINTQSAIPVEEIIWGGVPVDGIPPLEHPPVLAAEDASEMREGEPVFGLVVNGEARAYPLRIMDQHEMANDILGGEPVSLAYCTLCGAGIAYRTTQPDGTVFDFGTSGLLYRSNKLMYDRQTMSLWNQLTGVPVTGELAGSDIRLEVLPIVLTTWGEWKRDHPETTVLDLDTGFERKYLPGEPYSEYFSSSGTWFPIPGSDDRLQDKDQILAIEINGSPKAYPLDDVLAERVINDRLGGVDLVVVGSGQNIEVSGVDPDGVGFSYGAGGAARAYERDGHTFSRGSAAGTLTDESGWIWTVTEEALVGPSGEELSRLPGHLAFWFGWSGFHPDTDLYGRD